MIEKRFNPLVFFVISLLVLGALAGFLLYKSSNTKINSKKSANELLVDANMLYNKHSYSDALKLYEAITKKYSAYAPAYVGMGNSYLQLKKYDKAIESYNKSLILRNDDFLTNAGLGSAYLELEDYDKTYFYLRKTQYLAPNITRVSSNLLKLYDALGMYDEVINISLQELKDNTGKDDVYYRRIAMAYSFKKNYPKALEYAKKAVEYNKEGASNRVELAYGFLDMGNFEDAIIVFQNLSRIRSHFDIYEGLSVAYLLSGDAVKSNFYSQEAKKYPVHSLGASATGFTLLHYKQYDRAIAEFNLAINKTPQYYLPYKGLGVVYKELGQKNKAIQYLTVAKNLNRLDKETKKLLEGLI